MHAVTFNGTLEAIGENARYNCAGVLVNGRSYDMIHRNYFAHPILGCGQYVFSMMQAFGIHYRSAGENIGWVSGNLSTGAAASYINGAFMNSATTDPTSSTAATRRWVSDPTRALQASSGPASPRGRRASGCSARSSLRSGSSSPPPRKPPKPGPGGRNSPHPRHAGCPACDRRAVPDRDSNADTPPDPAGQPPGEPARAPRRPVRGPPAQQHRIRSRSIPDSLRGPQP